jgi:predicted nucleic acid-binding protein
LERRRKCFGIRARPQRRANSDQIIVAGRRFAFAETDQTADGVFGRGEIAHSYRGSKTFNLGAGQVAKRFSAAVALKRRRGGSVGSRHRSVAAIEVQRGDATAPWSRASQIDAERAFGETYDTAAYRERGIRREKLQQRNIFRQIEADAARLASELAGEKSNEPCIRELKQRCAGMNLSHAAGEVAWRYANTGRGRGDPHGSGAGVGARQRFLDRVIDHVERLFDVSTERVARAGRVTRADAIENGEMLFAGVGDAVRVREIHGAE